MTPRELDAAESIALWISETRQELRPQQVLDRCKGKLTARTLLALVRAHGLPARLVQTRPRDLERLATPTLLMLTSGETCILDQVRGGRARLRHGRGKSSSSSVEALAARVQVAVERMPPAPPRQSFLSGAWSVLWHRRESIAWLLVVSISLSGLGLLLPWLTRLAVGQAVLDEAPRLLLALVLAMAAAAAVQAWLRWLAARTRIGLDAELVHVVSDCFLRRLLALPHAEHARRGLGRLLRSLGCAEEGARRLVSIGAAPVFDALSSSACWIAIAFELPSLAILNAALSALAWLGSFFLSRRAARLHGHEIAASAITQARLHELLSAVAVLKASRAEARGLLRWLDPLLAERGLALSRELTLGWLGTLTNALSRGGAAAVLILTASEALAGRLAVADVVYLGMLSAGYLQGVAALCQTLVPFSALRTYAAEVDEVLAIEPATTPAQGVGGRDLAAGIELEDVWFRYGPDEPWVLAGRSLKLRAGEHTELAGPSGSGKTTILRLIAGLYRPERGKVSVFGRDPWQARDLVTYLPQHAQLFSGSLRENLMQLSGASFERVAAACAETGLSEWLATLPMGLDTLVAPGGANLSGGQRQWVVLTAAAAAERPVVLLDEAMSQMDPATKRALSRARLFTGRTTIGVTHDG